MNRSDIDDILAERGDVLAGKALGISGDATDNPFLDISGRFSGVLEDELPTRWLVSDYRLSGDSLKEEPTL